MNKNTFTIIFLSLISICLSAQNSYEEAMEICKSTGYLESQECMKGHKIPAFEGTTIDGEEINQNTIKDKILVLNFWFISCPPCIAEMSGLNEVVDHYSERTDVEFISLTRETSQTLKDEFFPNYKLKFKIIPDSEDLIQNTFKSWWGFPTTIVVDKSGRVHKIFSGGSSDKEQASKDVRETLVGLIKECLEK